MKGLDCVGCRLVGVLLWCVRPQLTRPVRGFASMSWLVWLLLVAVYWSLKWSFKNALMPKWLALPWGSVHFAIWDVLVRAAHRVYGFRAAPWKEIRPGLWLGKYVLASHVPALKALGIKRVLNLQAENVGPVAAYREAGIEQLYLPVIDHCEPSPEQIEEGVCFIERAIADGHGCYVHCQGNALTGQSRD